jgi:hypothetical protein
MAFASRCRNPGLASLGSRKPIRETHGERPITYSARATLLWSTSTPRSPVLDGFPTGDSHNTLAASLRNRCYLESLGGWAADQVLCVVDMSSTQGPA